MKMAYIQSPSGGEVNHLASFDFGKY